MPLFPTMQAGPTQKNQNHSSSYKVGPTKKSFPKNITCTSMASLEPTQKLFSKVLYNKQKKPHLPLSSLQFSNQLQIRMQSSRTIGIGRERIQPYTQICQSEMNKRSEDLGRVLKGITPGTTNMDTPAWRQGKDGRF